MVITCRPLYIKVFQCEVQTRSSRYQRSERKRATRVLTTYQTDLLCIDRHPGSTHKCSSSEVYFLKQKINLECSHEIEIACIRL